jgi:hypothetical protein
MTKTASLVGLTLSIVLSACSSATDPTSSSADQTALSGCNGTASSTQPANGSYYLTSFGFSPGDDGTMSCGENTKTGTWYYAASRQRFGCGAHIQIEANGKCVVAETDDYGPDVCVENAAGRPIIDASPLVSEALFGVKSAGWSDRLSISVSEVAADTPLGPCASSGGSPPPVGTEACSDDADCNGGNSGTQDVCGNEGYCIKGCHGDGDCPSSTSCQPTSPHWSCQ